MQSHDRIPYTKGHLPQQNRPEDPETDLEKGALVMEKLVKGNPTPRLLGDGEIWKT
ncbi:hypothetical protein RhiLY_00100 [Ceratobasidium sp. AG-Ba]|nr:hypothetical protein RhiLY_00100 [Ceratobasidium sp. AG-Ba]